MLFVQGIEFRKTHDLYELADKLEKAGIALPISADALAQINPYAVEFRYGDEIIPTINRGEVESIAMRMLTWAVAISEGQ